MFIYNCYRKTTEFQTLTEFRRQESNVPWITLSTNRWKFHYSPYEPQKIEYWPHKAVESLLSVVSGLPGNPRLSTSTQSLKQNCSDLTQIHGSRHGNYRLKYSNEMNPLKFTVVRIPWTFPKKSKENSSVGNISFNLFKFGVLEFSLLEYCYSPHKILFNLYLSTKHWILFCMIPKYFC